ncbi:hypothetical protein G7072_11090 [Nocardioides sp. HDW12B]|uniref:hypothetical protein n=1 Tax=Nocardioides sp. HDW12B TaxID=2714939 RepID=UPI00140CC025|nr:hypothetical protein [Nocardioides sp. HDW12B]QIK66813.1 hypothetical protein G7072_11090 [Nocardioides sp. HDW12B]
MSKALARSARTWLDLSAARFGQARAITNARHEATRLSRQRVEREDVRLYLDQLDGPGRHDGPDLDGADRDGSSDGDIAPPRRGHA